MTRYIDADALREKLQNEIDKAIPPFDDVMGSIRCGVRLARNIVEDEPTVDAVPVVMIEGRVNDLKKMLIDIDPDDVDNIWVLRTEIDTLTELLEMWAERKEG